MPTRIGILATPDSPYAADLQRAARQMNSGPEIGVLSFSQLQVSLGCPPSSEPNTSRTPGSCDLSLSPRIRLEHAAGPRPHGERDETTREPDAVIVRSMPLGSLEQVIFRMDCLQAWEQRGVAIVNPPRSLEVAIDKWLTLHRLSAVGIPVPATVACQSRAEALEAFDSLGRDVLLKPLFGGEGRGIMRIDDPDMAWRVFGSLQQVGQVLYIQQFVEHFGYDIRVLFIGQDYYAIKRSAPPGAWRTNLTQGSQAQPHHLTDEQLDMARRCAAVVGGSVMGVDLLPCRDGRLVALEVNAVPGWKGLGATLDVDIAQKVICHVCDMVRN